MNKFIIDTTDEQPNVTKEAGIKRRKSHDKETVLTAANGKWQNLLSALTGYSADYFDGKSHDCPGCGGVKNKFSMFNDNGGCGCFQCDRREGTGFGTISWLRGVSLEDAINMVGDELRLEPKSRRSKPLPAAAKSKPKPKPKNEISEADAELRNKVYSTLSSCYGLNEIHREALKARGLSDSDIATEGYFSVSSKRIPAITTLKIDKATNGLATRADIANKVPGVYKSPSEISVFSPTLLIPVRDVQGRIIALRVRPDTPKPKFGKYGWLTSNYNNPPLTSPGTPAHVPTHSDPPEVIRITEGEFKANIATQRTKVLTLSVPGVECWTSAIPITEHYKPQKLLIAFDTDAATKKDVCRSLGKLWDALTTLSWKPAVAVETWPQDYKGIDDALTAGVAVQELSFDQSLAHIARLKVMHGLDKPTLQELLDDLREYEQPHDPNRLARVNLASYEENHGGRLVYWRESFYRYKAGGWRKISVDELNTKIRKSINSELAKIAKAQQEIENFEENPKPIKKLLISNNMVGNVLSELKQLTLLSNHQVEMPCLLSDPQNRQYLLSLQNGLLDLNRVIDGDDPAECFSGHESDWFSTTKLSFEFDGEGKCPQFMRYLETSLPDDSSGRLVQEFAGYLLIPDNPFQRFLVCEGDGGTGKSVLLSGVLTAMLGKQNVSSVKLDGFGGNQFSLIDAIGKAANIDPDVNQNAKFNEGMFKQFAVGERMQFEPKGVNPFSCIPTAKVILGWNNRPRIRDASDGLWRRMLLVGYENKIPEGSRIIGMDRPDWWECSGELPGIFNWALEGLRRLFDQGGFTVSQAMRFKLDDYRKEQNPLTTFLDECFEHDPQSKEKFATACMVNDYRVWASHNTSEADGNAMSAKRMGAAVKQKFGIESKAMRVSGILLKGFEGIRHKKPEESDETSQNVTD